MAKKQEELNELKEEYEALTTKLSELSEDELKQIIGGIEMKPIVGLDLGLVNSKCSNNQKNQK